MRILLAFLSTNILLSAVPIFLSPCPLAAQTPNIVIFYADDLGYGDLSCYGSQKIKTPHIDSLANSGRRFTDAHSSSGICSPSRYALLSGEYHWRKFHSIVQSFGPSVFDAAQLTLPELLKQQGYETSCIGKWHLGWNWNEIRTNQNLKGLSPADFDWSRPIPDGPLAHGFDSYFGDDVPNFPPYAWIENDRVLTAPSIDRVEPKNIPEGNWEARPGPMVEGWDFFDVMPTLTRKAVHWIEQRQGTQTPFFLYMPFTSPHAPIVPTQEFLGTSQAGPYGDYVVQTDHTVGEVLGALKKSNLLESTLIIFSADNGPERYAYDRIQNYDHYSMGALRGLKRDLWEGGHRVPLILSWPGHIPPHTTSDELISQIDLYATLAAITQAPIPSGQARDSLNQLPLITGVGPTARQVIIHNTQPHQYAIREENWLLINHKTGGVSQVPAWFDEQRGYSLNNSPVELYNLHDGITQHQNMADQHPEKIKHLQTLLQTLRDQ